MSKSFVFQMRRGLASEWYDANPVLRPGEFGISIDTETFKVGNGVTAWLGLPTFPNHDLIAQMIADAVIEGVPGPPGDVGPKGDKGDKGDQGIQGLKGDTGSTGPKGDPGDTGSTGPKGDPGDTGAQGSPGTPGADYSGPTITVSNTAPSTPAVGDVWIDTSS